MDREKEIRKIEQQIEAELKILQRHAHDLQMDVLNKHYFNLENLNSMGKLVLEVLTGKLGLMNKIPADTDRIVKIMEGSPLTPKDLYKTLSELFRAWIKRLEALGKTQRENAASQKGRAAEDSKIRAFFTELLKKIILEDLLRPLRDEIYPKKRQSKRTPCGAECVDGHPCQHEVWEGWICWQHGGSYVGNA